LRPSGLQSLAMVELVTERLRLRRARPEDLHALHAVLSHPAAMRYWSTPPHTAIDQTEAWLADMIEATDEDFVVEHLGRVIGKAGAYRLPNVGYILHPDCWGSGLATEALGAVIAHIFASRAVDRLTAETMVLKRHADGWRIHHIHWSSRAPR